jgi:hypothetical protein
MSVLARVEFRAAPASAEFELLATSSDIRSYREIVVLAVFDATWRSIRGKSGKTDTMTQFGSGRDFLLSENSGNFAVEPPGPLPNVP